jgi:hypothetical protein
MGTDFALSLEGCRSAKRDTLSAPPRSVRLTKRAYLWQALVDLAEGLEVERLLRRSEHGREIRVQVAREVLAVVAGSDDRRDA